jgi:predicted ATP-grasp superfamily ATP-dependent carboligase
MATIGLVLPTSSYRGPDFVHAADELGVDLVVATTDGSLGVPSGRIVRALAVDCDRPEEAADAFIAGAEGMELDAIVGVDDGGVLVAALVADRLGLPHNPPDSVAATRDKSIMRRLLDGAGVAQPRFAVVTDRTEAEAATEGIGRPVVIKPTSLSASRGVMLVRDSDDLAGAVQRLGAIQRDAGIEGAPFLVEEFVPGPEIAVEGLVSAGGDLEVLAVFDKPDPLDGPYFEETIYVTPSRHDPSLVAAAVALVAEAVEALGLAFGPVHAEVRLAPEGPRLIEVAARSIGGLCGRSLQFGMLRQSLEVLLLRAALGMNRRGMGPSGGAAGAMMIPIPAGGTLHGVRGIEAVAEVEGITEVTITVPPGRRIDPLPEGDRYLGFIISRAERPEQIEAALREAHGLLDIDIRP